MSKKSLPWVIEPQAAPMETVGGEYGSLKIAKLNTLTVNELQFIQDNTKDLPDYQELSIRLASEIANEKGCSFKDAFEIMSAGQTDDGSITTKLLEFKNKSTLITPKRNAVLATAMIKFRIDKDWALEDTQDPNKIPPLLVSDLAEFCANEMNGWIDAEGENNNKEKTNNQMTEEQAKKS